MSVGVEGLYYAFGDSEKNSQGSVTNSCCVVSYNVTQKEDNDLFVLRGRLNYFLSDDRDGSLK